MGYFKIVALGLIAFAFGTAAGVLFGKIMCWATKGKVNPHDWVCGRICSSYGGAVFHRKWEPRLIRLTCLLMHAMGPNVAGVIGTAVAAGNILWQSLGVKVI